MVGQIKNLPQRPPKVASALLARDPPNKLVDTEEKEKGGVIHRRTTPATPATQGSGGKMNKQD